MDLKDLRKLFRAATGGRHGGGKDEYRYHGGSKPRKRKHRGWHPHRADGGHDGDTGYGYGRYGPPPHGYSPPTPPYAGGYGHPPPRRSLKETLLAAALEWFRNRGRY